MRQSIRRLLIISCPLILAGLVAAIIMHASRAAGQRSYAHTTINGEYFPVLDEIAAERRRYGLSVTASAVSLYVPGVSAIHPTLKIAAGDLTQAAYTSQDVERYLQYINYYFPTTDGSIPHITRLLMVPASQASGLLGGESIGRPNNALVVYVTIQGNLQNNPRSPTNSPAHQGTLVFDAQTGNLIISAVY